MSTRQSITNDHTFLKFVSQYIDLIWLQFTVIISYSTSTFTISCHTWSNLHLIVIRISNFTYLLYFLFWCLKIRRENYSKCYRRIPHRRHTSSSGSLRRLLQYLYEIPNACEIFNISALPIKTYVCSRHNEKLHSTA